MNRRRHWWENYHQRARRWCWVRSWIGIVLLLLSVAALAVVQATWPVCGGSACDAGASGNAHDVFAWLAILPAWPGTATTIWSQFKLRVAEGGLHPGEDLLSGRAAAGWGLAGLSIALASAPLVDSPDTAWWVLTLLPLCAAGMILHLLSQIRIRRTEIDRGDDRRWK